MGVPESGVGHQQPPLLTGPLGESFGPELLQELPGSIGRRRWIVRRNRRREQTRRARLARDRRIAVHDHVRQVAQELGRAVAPRNEAEELGRLLQPARGDAPRLEIRVVHHVFEKRNVGLDAAHAELAEAAIHALAGVREFAAPRGGLHQQRIVIRRDHRAAVGRTAVEANAESRGRAVCRKLAVIGNEVVGGIFGGDAALQRVPVKRHPVLAWQVHFRAVQFETLGNLDLAAHQVDAGHHFGDGVLHLNPRIDFDEVPLARVGIHQELHRAGVVVSGGPGQRDRGLRQRGANRRAQRNRGRHFDHFLMTPLHRAIALVQVENVAVPVAQNLDFDVARPPHETLHEYGLVAESRAGLAPGLFEQSLEIGGTIDHSHAASAASERGFDDQREADLRRCLRIVGARHYGDAGPLRQLARRSFIAQEVQQLRAGADKRDARPLARPGQRRILRQEAVARVNRVDTFLLRQRHDAFHIQVSLDRPFAFADQIGFIRLEAMQREPVFLGVDGHRPQTQFVGGAEDADSDLAAIQSKEFFHGRTERDQDCLL